MKHKFAIGARMLTVSILILSGRPNIHWADASTGPSTMGVSHSAHSLGTAALTGISTLVEAVHHVPERAGLVLLGVALLGSATLLRRKWKVVRPS